MRVCADNVVFVVIFRGWVFAHGEVDPWKMISVIFFFSGIFFFTFYFVFA